MFLFREEACLGQRSIADAFTLELGDKAVAGWRVAHSPGAKGGGRNATGEHVALSGRSREGTLVELRGPLV